MLHVEPSVYHYAYKILAACLSFTQTHLASFKVKLSSLDLNHEEIFHSLLYFVTNITFLG